MTVRLEEGSGIVAMRFSDLRNTLIWMLTTAALALSLAACGGADASRGDLPPNVVSELESASPFERKIIADGEVTSSEYERAVLSTLSCLDERGILHSAAVFNVEANRWDYQVGPWPKSEDEQYEAKYDECFNEFEQAVSAVWSGQNEPSQEEIGRIQAAILICLREHGLRADDYRTFVERQAQLSPSDLQIALDCKVRGYRSQKGSR